MCAHVLDSYLSSFSLNVFCHHRYLHSFPTRRSSDLLFFDDQGRVLLVHPTYKETWDIPGRSEEHTSELQSLRHLVCRLLLEKKKKHYNYNLHTILTTHH